MQKHMKDYLNELRKQQQRRKKAAIAAVLLVVLVVGMVANGLTGSGSAMTGEGMEEQLENFDDLEQASEMSSSYDEPVEIKVEDLADEPAEIVEEDPVDEPAETEVEDPAELEAEIPDGNPDNAGDAEVTDGNPDNAADAEMTDGNSNSVTDLKLFDTEEDEEEDLSGLPTMEEMDGVPIDQTRATIQKAPALFRLIPMDESGEIEEDTNENWDFSVYYQNSDDDSDVRIIGDTSVKYQMEFHTDVALAPGKVEIRIPYGLFPDRNGTLVTPSEIAVSQSPSNDDNESVYNKSTPFNYYITALDGNGNPTESSELVFFNYRRITAGTNAAWQVLFKNIQIMRLKDKSDWELQAKALVTKPKYEYDYETGRLVPVYEKDNNGEIKVDEDGKPVAIEQEEKMRPAPLTGVVDSSVTLVSVAKNAYKEANKKYTPGLYTKAQVENYIGDELPQKYADNFNDWKFVVWEVTMEGSATQPWNLVLSEALTAKGKPAGEVVGYRNHTNSTYFFAINEGKEFEVSDSTNLEATVVENSWETYFRSRFYVVTAYSRSDVSEGDQLENTLTVKMVPVDSADKTQSRKIQAVWKYENYNWIYSGDVIGIDKVSDTVSPYDQKDYDSWLEAYSKAMDAGEDYGSLWFASTGSFKGYGNTHSVQEETGTIGSYREGTGYELTTVDDFMYATPSGTGGSGQVIMLNWKDYYYSGVKVTQTDHAYDFLEDQETSKLEREAEGVYLYAMYAKPGEERTEWTDTDKNTWVPVNGGEPVVLDSSTSKAVYTFSQEELAREPWRVKAVHTTTEYKTECRIDVNVSLRTEPSEALAKIMKDYKEDRVNSVKLEDLSGVLGRTYTTGADEKREYTICETDNGANYTHYEGLEAATKELYENEYEDQERKTPIQRDNASVTVYGLRKEADAFKTYRTTNDVANSRAMVDFYLTAYDGYKVHEESAVNYLKSMGVPTPGKNHVMFYDLLPFGMYFDPSQPVFAGRITELDRNGYYKSRTNYWDDAQVELSNTEVLDNWNGTGRTMLIFHIDYTGADPAIYTDGKWLEGWGVSFRAYYEWKDSESVQKQYNISAFMPDVAKYDDPAVELLGQNEKIYKDGEVPLYDNDYADFKEKGRLNSANTADVGNVLYAKCQAKADLATASKATIEKLVRTDSDIFSVYNDSAYAEEGEGYTYKITVETKNEGLTDLVVFDHLEHASVERAGITTDPNQSRFPGSSEELWHGIFRGVQLSGLTAKGVEPVVWYNTARNAATTGTMPTEGSSEGMTSWGEAVSLDNVLTSEYGWYEEVKFIEKYKTEHLEEITGKTEAEIKELAFAEVKSIAVDLRKAAGTENRTFELKQNDSVSFLIRMRAPEMENEESEENTPKERYAYNNPSYYSRSVTNNEGTTQSGESVRVRLGGRYTLEVIKELEGDAPGSFKEQSFTFRAYRLEQEISEGEDGDTSESKVVPLSNKEYTLWTKAEGTEDGWKKLAGGPYATDANGYFPLQAGQRAVFDNVSNAKDVIIEETESLFWNVLDTTSTAKDEAKGTVTYIHTVKNQYRYVLYVQKKTEGVPEEVSLSNKERIFTFQIELGGEQQVLDYCRVDRVRLDGVSPEMIPFDDGEKIHRTKSDGTFEIQEGWILALFLPEADIAYELTELYEKDGIPLSENWMENGSVTGTGSAYGKSVIITNRYKWKDLYLTKEITHQEAKDCHETFTFRISRWVEDTNSPAGGSWEPVRSENEWVMLDSESEGQEASDEGTDTGEDEDETSGAVYGNLDEEGIFSAACAGRTILIKNLEAGVKYQIKEIQVSENYQPGYLENGSFVQSDTVEVTMPVFSESKKVEIINDYLLRPLSVTKTVVSDEMTDGTSFRMILAKVTVDNYVVLPGQTYIVKETGDTGITDENGVFSLQAGQTAVFESLGKRGEKFVIWEIQDKDYPQIYPAGNKDFINNEEVGAPVEAVLTDAGADTQFINGSPELMLLSKEYEGGDLAGAKQIKRLKDQIEDYKQEMQAMMARVDELKMQAENGTNTEEDIEALWKEIDQLRNETERVLSLRWNENMDYDVRVQLTSEQEGWSLESSEHSIICIDQLMGRVYELTFDRSDGWTIWYYDEIGDRNGPELPVKKRLSDCDAEALLAYRDGSFNLKPWMTYVIHMGGGVSYTVTEEDPYEYRPDMGYVISQKIPEPGGSLTGRTGKTSTAVLCNEIKTFSNNIQKKMTPDSDPVPTGKELVWCVQRYNGFTKRWEAAEGIEYIVLEGDADGIYDSIGSIQTTGADGKIRLSRSNDQNTYLSVQFLQSDRWVSLNMESADPGTLRVIELLEESDPAWGTLSGYGSPAMGDRYSMDVNGDYVSIIYNSNRTIQVEIEKQTEERVNETFTMFLKQVIRNQEGEESYRPRQGIAYTVYDSETDQEAGSRITGINGEIRMLDGQYVRLSLPSGTVWAVSEDQDAVPNFKLTDLEKKDKVGLLSKEGDNLMRIGTLNLEEAGTTYITAADVHNGVIDADTGEKVFFSEKEAKIPRYILQKSTNTKYLVTGIADDAFANCEDLTKITIPDSVTHIGARAFAHCGSLTEITIPDSVTYIGARAFAHCGSLTEIMIPQSTTRIADEAFYKAGLKSVTVPSTVKELGDHVFAKCENLEKAVINCEMECLNTGIFQNCSALSHVEITGNIKRIERKKTNEWFEDAFNSCGSLTDVTLPESLEEIGAYVFEGCWTLSSITIPKNIITIGDGAFAFSGLTTVTIPKSVKELGDNVFECCESLEKATIECNVKRLGAGIFRYCTALTCIDIPEGVSTIGESAFDSCWELKQIVFPSSMRTIGENAFRNCRELADVPFKEGLTTIGRKAFQGCQSLEQITLPGSMRTIGESAFEHCAQLTDVTFKEGLTTIGKKAFRECGGLEQIAFPGTLTIIEAYAFEDCGSLLNVTFSSGSNPTIDPTAFLGTPYGEGEPSETP